MTVQTAHPMPGSGLAVPVIEDGALRWRDPSEPGLASPQGRRACVLVPNEQVVVVVVELPLSSHRQRLEAAPYAVEGMLAEPLSAVHVVLGPEVAPKRYLAAVVRNDLMAQWTGLLARAGLAQARLLPDALALPLPAGDGWTVLARSGRALVRRADQSGFAVDFGTLDAAWRIAGRPPIQSLGDQLPPHFGAIPFQSGDARPDPVSASFDLRQGAHAGSSGGGSAFLRRAGWIAGVGFAALAAILVADTIALDRLAAERREEARAVLQRIAPDADRRGDVAIQLARLLPAESDVRQGRFLPFLARIAEAFNAQGDAITVQTLRYDAQSRELSLDVSAKDLAALQRIEAALASAGLQASSGVATAESGAAEVRIVLVDADGGGGS